MLINIVAFPKNLAKYYGKGLKTSLNTKGMEAYFLPREFNESNREYVHRVDNLVTNDPERIIIVDEYEHSYHLHEDFSHVLPDCNFAITNFNDERSLLKLQAKLLKLESLYQVKEQRCVKIQHHAYNRHNIVVQSDVGIDQMADYYVRYLNNRQA